MIESLDSADDDETALDMFRALVADSPDSPLLDYFDNSLSVDDIDRLSDSLAAGLSDGGFHEGDRLALYLQNVPQYVVTLLAVWKLKGIAVAINPMLTGHEVSKLLADSTPKVLVCLDELFTLGIATAVANSTVTRVITTSPLDWRATIADSSIVANTVDGLDGCEDLSELIKHNDNRKPPHLSPVPDDVAVITYTSGTTGVPKGAMNSHRNVATGGRAYRDWFGLGRDDIILGIAPLFHVTGLSGHIASTLAAGARLILLYRFTVDEVARVVRDKRPTFTVGAITAFIALANSPEVRHADLASLTKVASGGAPVAAATIDNFEDLFGSYIHNVYGMTETTSPVLAVPMNSRAPVGTQTEALSVGVPVITADVAVVGDDGLPVAVGELGEVAVSGPQVITGYWNNPAADAEAFRNGRLLTGDVGYRDDAGWFYLVDRRKDMIIASGYKVWPREVEDTLYKHEAVLEAGVVGQPDDYRGESVMAFVSLRDGFETTPQELIDFCRSRMAAYKYPREVVIVDAIPKTVTGKVLRRELRPGIQPELHRPG
ncbi:class I adenylate-forming enzyme family protein [Gordonia insulae]|uniref:Long-chain-fatty-acid--CoA ligase n=1 Tax=Gordonia insulae TaxID=2420509 RepID=A0A3G8JLP1_9ACTN|nr:AMP-binding protein [Gordonia insulae]AZG45492.1 Long-chain-fatty-acid--CoA ligase [Gordonia insulae]